MSILLKDHDLESSVSLLLLGIKKFNNTANDRITSGDWSDEHIKELDNVRKLLLDLQIKLIKI